MTNRICILIAVCLMVFGAAFSGQNRSLSGSVLYEGPDRGPVRIHLYMLSAFSDGKIIMLTKGDIYGDQKPYRKATLDKPGRYAFSGLPAGKYSVSAFMDADNDGELDFSPPEPFGWYASRAAGRWDAVDLTAPARKNLNFSLRKPTPFPREDRFVEHGALRWMQGLPVLQLWGTVRERGFAHGFLAAEQIIDFFAFYVLEDSWGSAERYENIFIPFLKSNLRIPSKLLHECEALIRGMKAADCGMTVPFLNREFGLYDLLAVNAYIERRAAFPVSPPSSCTQFAFWGSLTEDGTQRGGLMAARNMDGECDIRKVTVSHFLLFAVDPAEEGRKRWFSAMWPGFVGTISGINEDGLYSMENAGGTAPGPVVAGIVPCSFVQRIILETEGEGAGPEKIIESMSPFVCEGGGVTAPGSIILWAVPFRGQKNPAFIYEGDRFGGAMRLPSQAGPFHPHCLLASNHHKVYGFDPSQPGRSFGRPVSFSSLWRYETGKNQLDAWARTGETLGLAEAKRLLQSVSHGSTEYSVIFSAGQMRIHVAVDDLKTDMWDAPYLTWKDFLFEDLFNR